MSTASTTITPQAFIMLPLSSYNYTKAVHNVTAGDYNYTKGVYHPPYSGIRS